MNTSISLLGTGDMGTALGRAWLAAGVPLTVWNRTPARAAALGAPVAASAAEAVAASRLVVLCLLDDASVGSVLDGFASLLVGWLTAMAPAAMQMASQLADGDYTRGVVSNLAMQVAGNATLVRTAEEQGVSTELLAPYFDVMRRRLEDGHGEEDGTGIVELLTR